MRHVLLLALALALAACKAHAIPTNPAVTPKTVAATMCKAGWSESVRPPLAYTNRIKRGLMRAAGIPQDRSAAIELDHKVPISLGGSPTDVRNLWLQAWDPVTSWPIDPGAHDKDVLEKRLQRLVCKGALALRKAQRCIFKDWRRCAAQYP